MTNIEIETVIASLDWNAITGSLDTEGYATTGRVLDESACTALRDGYADGGIFRSRIVMSRHGFGRGEYQYYAAPLPPAVATLRSAFYGPLVRIANRWAERLAEPDRYDADLPSYLARCHAAGQTRPTPLLLKYGAGDYNCLHQDLYGALAFPLQVAILLSDPVRDFTGGEFMLVEQRPRMQSRGQVVPLSLGEAVIFPVRNRPVIGGRGEYRVTMRHGVSRVRSGDRFTLGVIFHDAA
jgi:uncharacterized protein